MPKKSTWQSSHPECAAAAREAVEAVRAEYEELRTIVWGLVPGDYLDRGGCWCRAWPHEPECERLRAWFAKHGTPPMRRDIGQVGQVRQG